MKTLHIVDGDSTGGTLKMSGVARSKDILSWRDALYTGPVPAGLTLRQLSRLRSKFWTNGTKSSEFDKRDATLAQHEDYEHIALWFGPGCTLCHLSLAQLLRWFREKEVDPSLLSWVAVHGGELLAEQMPGAYAARRRVTAAQLQLSARLWRAFRHASPSGLAQLVRSDLRAIPGLRRAVLWLLQEYPSRRNGLSRLENELLREVARFGNAKASRAIMPVLISETGVGDDLLFDMLRNFVRGKRPLAEFAQPFAGKIQSRKFRGSTLRLTEVGRRVLDGKADAIALNGIDRWIGGVHLHGHKVRWH